MTDPLPLPADPSAPASPSDAPLLLPEASPPALAAPVELVAAAGDAALPSAEIAPDAALADAATADPAAPATLAIPDMPPAQTAARLAELFPAVFTPGSPRPLKLRIQADVQQRAPGIFNRKSLSVFLHRHTTSNGYLKALATGPARIDLDGLAAGEVSEEHRLAATAELERRRGLQNARRAAEREAQRAAFDQARRARVAEQAGAPTAEGALTADGAAVAAPAVLGDRPPRPPRPPREGDRGQRPRQAGDAVSAGRPPRHDVPRGRPGGADPRGLDSRGPDSRGPRPRALDVPRDGRPDPRREAGGSGAIQRDAQATRLNESQTEPAASLPPARPPMDDAQRARANALHAYETTTLTRANFCALKGWTDAQLEAMLIEARREREQRGPAPRPAAVASRPGGPAAHRGHSAPPPRRGPPGGPRSPR